MKETVKIWADYTLFKLHSGRYELFSSQRKLSYPLKGKSAMEATMEATALVKKIDGFIPAHQRVKTVADH